MGNAPRDLRLDQDRSRAEVDAAARQLSEIPERVARRAVTNLAVRVVEEKPDYFVCVELDESDLRPLTLADPTDTTSTNRSVVNVAKDVEMRRSHWHNKIRPNREGELTKYIAQDENGTERRNELADDDEIFELQVVIPPILPEQTISGTIYAGSYLTIKVIANGTGVDDDAGNPIFYLDSNNGARAFAEKDSS